jgi:hypothetical protein
VFPRSPFDANATRTVVTNVFGQAFIGYGQLTPIGAFFSAKYTLRSSMGVTYSYE